MLIISKRIFKSIISTILITVLIFSGLFLSPDCSNAATKTLTETKTIADLAYYDVWKHADGTWQKGIKPGSSVSATFTIGADIVPCNATVISCTGEFDSQYNDPRYILNTVTSGFLSETVSYNANNKTVTYSVNTALMAKTEPRDITNEGQLDQVEGYRYYIPVLIHITYQVVTEIGDFVPDLDIPSAAKQGETYTVSDATLVDSNTIIDHSLLEKHYGDGDWESVATWDGTGTPGENTGGNISESCDTPCTITYRITVYDNNDRVKSITKTINITDGREVNGNAILELPEYTYEGHPALATDVSEFKVNGIDYSARRAYEEGVASNCFRPLPSGSGNASRLTKTTADIIFPNKGQYNVKLEVDTIDGKTLTDTKPIEVRKTPYIMDRLGGFQKQNRKQILNLSIATYPGKPITDYTIEIKDLKTGQKIVLSETKPQENSAVIKTRAVKTSGDQYWTNYEVEFLTKTPSYDSASPEGSAQQFQYTVFVKDSKGDSDYVQKTFDVVPDKPPIPEIIMQNTFIRNQGTNIAEIIAEDGSTTDGDQLQRTWSFDGAELTEISGYRDLTFGSGQKVQFYKEGVGKGAVQLDLMEIWTEPTLEEYINETDFLTGSTNKITEVINIAPTVRLEPIETEKADVVLLTDKTTKSNLEEGLNSLKAALIEAGIDAYVQVLPVAEANNNGYRNVGSWSWPVSINCKTCQSTGLVFDSSYAYKIQSSSRTMSEYQEVCSGPHTLYALKPGEPLDGSLQSIAWSYTVNQSSDFDIELDSEKKYIYILCRDTKKTILLNKDNGAYVTTLNLLLPGKPYLSSSGTNMFFLMSDKIQKYNVETGQLTTVLNKGGSLGRLQGGKLVFVGKEKDNKYYIGKFDLNTEILEGVPLPKLPSGQWRGGNKSAISPTDMDSSEMVTFTQTFNDRDNDTKGCYIWLVDSKKQNVHVINREKITNDLRMNSVGFVENETGEAVYMYHAYSDDNSTPTTTKGYFTLDIYTLGIEGAVPEARTIYDQKNNRLNYTGISYAKYHSQENAIYIMQGADYGWNGLIPGVQCRIALPAWTADYNQYGWGWDVAEEQGEWNDSLMATFYSAESWTGMDNRVKLFRNSITEEQAESSAIQRLGNFRKEATKVIEGFYDGSQLNIQELLQGIKGKLEENRPALWLRGDGGANRASISKKINLEEGQKYEYEYDLTAIGGTTHDIFKPIFEDNDTVVDGQRMFKETVAERDFAMPGQEPFFRAGSSYKLDPICGYTGIGSGYYGSTKESKIFSCWLEVDMEKSGFVEFDFFRALGSLSSASYEIKLDGVLIDKGTSERFSHNLYFLEQGSHRFEFHGKNDGCIGFNHVKASYLYPDDHEFTNVSLSGLASGDRITVRNSFYAPRSEAFTTKASTKGTFIKETFEGNQITQTSYISFTANRSDCPWIFNSAGSKASMSSTYYGRGSGSFNVTAPQGKTVVMTYRESVNGESTIPTNSGDICEIAPTTVVVKPGQKFTRSFSLKNGKDGGGNVTIYDMRLVVFNSTDYKPDKIFARGHAAITEIIPGAENFSLIDIGTNGFTLTDYRNVGGSKKTAYATFSSGDLNFSEQVDAYISNFCLYKLNGNMRQLILTDKFDEDTRIEDNVVSEEQWGRNVLGDGKAEVSAVSKPAKAENEPMVFKKGELVAYGIFYDDYERDPSKRQFWKYTHTPYNDGAHPEAAVVLSEDDQIISETDKVLSSPISRFYIDGKYTVEHWQEDNTNRTGDNSGSIDYSAYDKSSNVERITFYVEGGATAPWITSIKTIPRIVKEGTSYRIEVGVDDLEKDELRLTTEVYKDKKLMYTHKQNGIMADENGKYPLILTGFAPAAAPGKYEVVCTVRDWSGVGMDSYKFIVVSEGKITGWVNHTDQWNINRKKYNLKRFDNEINRVIPYSDYLAMSIPRQRGENVFWSGEKFVLKAETEGQPVKVNVQIEQIDRQGALKQTEYAVSLTKSGQKGPSGGELWTGELWDKTMINKWGRKKPEELNFKFTAVFSSGETKVEHVRIIVDSQQDYWQLHRLW